MKTKNKYFWAQTLSMLAIIASILVVYFFVDFGAVSDRFKALGYEPSDEVSALETDLRLTKRARGIFAASHPRLQESAEFNSSCASVNVEISVLGCYTMERIFVYDINGEDLEGIKQSTLAHELLHAAWDRMKSTERELLHDELRAVYDEHIIVLEPRLELYAAVDFYDELHSIIGTEFAELSKTLETHYAKYFTDQDAIVDFYDNYNARFQELKEESDALYEQIEINQELIDAKTENYNDAVTELNAAIEDFNRRAQNGYFTSVGAFNAERALLVAQQQTLDTLYLEISELIAATNSLIESYNTNIVNTQALLDLINSNAESTPEVE